LTWTNITRFSVYFEGEKFALAPTASYHFKNTCDKKKNDEFSGGGRGAEWRALVPRSFSEVGERAVSGIHFLGFSGVWSVRRNLHHHARGACERDHKFLK